ncbi:MAG: SRPBCC family protein [Gammaproteobacteria bacterium]|jgi:uncharacterized membrane protein|nr:SRPBCC family protein [Gammaproteobacteria bacterium]
MPEITESITINRPVTEVFRTVADMNRASEWQPDVSESSMSDEKMRVGIILSQTRSTHVLGWRLDLNADVLEYTPNRLIELQGVLGRFPATVRYTFESRGGATAVTETVQTRPGCLYAPVGPLLSSAVRGRTRRALEGLKEKLETRGGTGQVTNFQNLPDE